MGNKTVRHDSGILQGYLSAIQNSISASNARSSVLNTDTGASTTKVPSKEPQIALRLLNTVNKLYDAIEQDISNAYAAGDSIDRMNMELADMASELELDIKATQQEVDPTRFYSNMFNDIDKAIDDVSRRIDEKLSNEGVTDADLKMPTYDNWDKNHDYPILPNLNVPVRNSEAATNAQTVAAGLAGVLGISGLGSLGSNNNGNGGTMIGDTIEDIHTSVETTTVHPQTSEERETVDIGDAGRNALSGAEGTPISSERIKEELSSDELNNEKIRKRSNRRDESDTTEIEVENPEEREGTQVSSTSGTREKETPFDGTYTKEKNEENTDDSEKETPFDGTFSLDTEDDVEQIEGIFVEEDSNDKKPVRNGGTMLGDTIESIHEAIEKPSPRPQASEERETVDIGDAGRNALSGAEGHSIDIHKEEESSSGESAIIDQESPQSDETTSQVSGNQNGGTMLGDTIESIHEATENPSPRPQASEEREIVDIGDAGRNALSGAEGHSIDIHKEEESSSGESADQESPQSDKTTSQASGNQNGGTFLSDSIESIHEATENPSPRPQAREERETVDIGDAGRNALSGAEGHGIDIHKEEESSSGESADQESPQSDKTTSQASGNQNGGTFLSDSIESIHKATENPSPRPQASEERETVDIGDAGRNALSGAEGHSIDIHKEEESSSDESAIIENTQSSETTFVENRDNTIAGTMLNDTRVETHSEVARNTDDTRIETQVELARDTDDTKDEVVMQAETTTSSEERLKAVEERLKDDEKIVYDNWDKNHEFPYAVKKSDVKVETAENNDSENFVVSTPSSSSSVSGANPSSEIPSSPSNSSTPVISEPELTENPTNSNQEIISEQDKPVTQEPEGTQETNNPVSQEVNDEILPFVPEDNEEVTVPVIKEEPKPSKPSKIDVTSSKSNVTYKEYEPSITNKILDDNNINESDEISNSLDIHYDDNLIENQDSNIGDNSLEEPNSLDIHYDDSIIDEPVNLSGDEDKEKTNDTLKTLGTMAGIGLGIGAAAYGASQFINNKTPDDNHYEYEGNDKDEDDDFLEKGE